MARRQATLPAAWWGQSERRRRGRQEGSGSGSGSWEAAGPGPSGGFVSGPAAALWLFPSASASASLEERAYQVRAARAALEANTLLCLPTGLGKTLVAAVVLYNFYRWFPGGKVLFLAPTRPLVAQQRLACARLMGLPGAHMALLTGK